MSKQKFINQMNKEMREKEELERKEEREQIVWEKEQDLIAYYRNKVSGGWSGNHFIFVGAFSVVIGLFFSLLLFIFHWILLSFFIIGLILCFIGVIIERGIDKRFKEMYPKVFNLEGEKE